MKIAIIGYGKMGMEIETIAKERSHTVVSIDPNTNADFKAINEESLKGVDVCIEFTHPSVVLGNIKTLCELKKNAVIGTTGWYDNLSDVQKQVTAAGNGLIWSGNFSIGVNMFFKMIEAATKIANKVPEYDAFGYELHHNQKADSPSGTAVMISDIVKKNLDRKDKIVTERLDRKIEPNEFHFGSIRGGAIPGTHIVGFDSPFDTIELKHTARTRQGFALGAVLAAEYIAGKKGLHDIDDLMKNIIE